MDAYQPSRRDDRPPHRGMPTALIALLSAAAFVIVVAGMKSAAALLVPCFLAIFIAVICGPPLAGLRRFGCPTWLALLIVVATILIMGLGVGAVAANSVREFRANSAHYQARATEIGDEVLDQVERFLPANAASDPPTDGPGPETPSAAPITPESTVGDAAEESEPTTVTSWFQQFRSSLNVGAVFDQLTKALSELSALIGNAFFIVLAVIFILAEASGLPEKLRRAFARSDDVQGVLQRFAQSIHRYVAMKTLMSALTGAVVWVGLLILGVDFPILWALLAFFLNFIPNLGSVIAAAPAVLLAWVQLGGVTAGLTAAIYLVANFVVGNVIEPRVMGRGLDLSTLVVFISLVFWGWVFGPMGMLLSVPLTMLVKIALEASAETRWIAVLLGAGGDGSAAETVIPGGEEVTG